MSADQITPWGYCPECGSEEVRYKEGTHKQCGKCGQEWYSDIDYTDTVQQNLADVVSLRTDVQRLTEELSRRSDAGRVEVPEISLEDGEEILRSFPASLPAWEDGNWSLAFNKVADFLRSRLSPSPQPAPGAVDVVLDPPKSDRDCGDCTRLAICNGELACLCGPTSKMFDRKAPDYPLQPEERRVGPDEVVVPRSAAEYAIRAFDWIECPDSEHYEAWRAFLDALRTSAQDHNGEGAK